MPKPAAMPQPWRCALLLLSAPPVAAQQAAGEAASGLRFANGCADQTIWVAREDADAAGTRRLRLRPGGSREVDVDGGLLGALFRPQVGCDASGDDCRLGGQAGAADITLGATLGKGGVDWVDLTLAGGSALGFKLDIDGNCTRPHGDLAGPPVREIDCSGLPAAGGGCPAQMAGAGGLRCAAGARYAVTFSCRPEAATDEQAARIEFRESRGSDDGRGLRRGLSLPKRSQGDLPLAVGFMAVAVACAAITVASVRASRPCDGPEQDEDQVIMYEELPTGTGRPAHGPDDPDLVVPGPLDSLVEDGSGEVQCH